jgi:hypothetical protein
MTRILLFSRPFPLLRKMGELYEKIDGVQVDIVSDIKGFGGYSLVEYQHANLQRCRDVDIPDLNYEDIIKRDRYLVFKDRKLARGLVNAAWEFISSLFADKKFDLFIGLPTDNYIIHLFSIACHKNGVTCLFPDYSPLPGYIRFWDTGFRVGVREPEELEITQAIERLRRSDFSPVWLNRIRGNRDLFKILIREKARKYWFEIYKRLSGQVYSFHYNCVYPLGSNYVRRGISSLFVRNKFEKDIESISIQRQNYKSVAYFPLQFTPESSLNYAIPSPDFAIYQMVVEQLLQAVPDDVLLLVKEHPDFYGYRDPNFYDQFLSRANVRLLDVGISSSHVLELCDVVVTTGTSSTGIEAVIKGKHLISLGGGYYSDDAALSTIGSLESIGSMLPKLIESGKRPDEDQIRDFVRLVLTTTMPGDYDFDGRAGFDLMQAMQTIKNIIELGLSGSVKLHSLALDR